jgi:hypothetical protein
MHPGRKTTRSFTAAKRHSASSTEADSSHPCQKMARPDTLVSIPKGNASNGIHCFPTQMVYNCDPLRTNHHIFPSHPLVHPHSIASQSNINSRALHPNHGSNDQCDTEGGTKTRLE